LHFDFVFSKNTEVFFAYSYPFSFQDCEAFLRYLYKETKSIKTIYYKDEILIKSPEKRPIHLLTVTSIENKEEKL